MQIGTMQNVINEPIGSVFSQAKALGFASVELDWNEPGQAAPGGTFSPYMCAHAKLTAARNGITIASVAAHFLNNGNIASADVATVTDAMLQIRRGIRICQAVGARVLLVPFFFKADIIGEAGLERLMRNLRVLAYDAEQAGVVLGVESTLSAADNCRVVDTVASPAVGIYWDMANGMAVGYDPVADVRAMGQRIVQVHGKEFAHDGGAVGTREQPRFDRLNAVPLGQGDVPVAAIMQTLREVGYSGHVVLETGHFNNHHASAQAAAAVLRHA
jgi:sugar phosphate isomerase/epimerase